MRKAARWLSGSEAARADVVRAAARRRRRRRGDGRERRAGPGAEPGSVSAPERARPSGKLGGREPAGSPAFLVNGHVGRPRGERVGGRLGVGGAVSAWRARGVPCSGDRPRVTPTSSSRRSQGSPAGRFRPLDACRPDEVRSTAPGKRVNGGGEGRNVGSVAATA